MVIRLWFLVVLCGATAASALEPATLDRPYDPVVIASGRLAGLPGRRVDALRLLRLRDGVAQPIPFQIDTRDADGKLELGASEPVTFDANDDFVFMAVDAGDRATAPLWPPECGPGLELTVREPDGQGRAWAYLVHCAAMPAAPPSPPYVVYDRSTNRARSGRYEVEYAAGRNYFTALRLIGADGNAGANLLRQTRMRGSPTFGLLVTDFSLEFTEQNAIVEVQGVRNGPVRAIRRAKLSVDLGPMIPDLPQGMAETFHYRNAFVTPTRFGIPAIALRMLRDFHFENMIDFNPQAMPLLYWDASRASGVALAAEPAETVEDQADHDWWVHSGPDGAVLHSLLIPQQWRDWGITRGALLRAGCAAGGPCAAGYTLRNMTRLQRAGDFDLMQATVVLPRTYQPGDERPAMAMLTRPVEVDVAVLP
ncbi:MAG: hypothetical protein SF182_08405 [Deltaproteobacteria bacterium]|nr:hypothetical protein [Deltaproteobacteria bacterium]